jgi:hypothetical protein
MPTVLVTGASQNHFKSLLQLLRTVPAGTPCYVYNLGLDADSLAALETHPIRLRHFDYSKYPAYYNIHVNAGEYAWKPAILLEVFNELLASSPEDLKTTVLLWCDAGNCLPADIQPLANHTLQHLIYSPISSGSVQRWTHPLTLQWFHVPSTDPVLNFPNRNGAILGFAIGDSRVQTFLQNYASCARIRECIAPEGSDRSNHRQDQAVFTLLYYMFIREHSIPPCAPHYMGLRIHCDID